MPELSVEQMQNYLLDHLQPETEDEETTAFTEHINNIIEMIRKVMRGD